METGYTNHRVPSKRGLKKYKLRVVMTQGGFSVTRFDYNGASKSRDLLKIQGLSWVEILFVKKNPLQDLVSSLSAVISTNERH